MNRFYVLIVFFCIVLTNNTAYSSIYDNNSYYLNNLTNAEMKLFGRSYTNNNPYVRLARAEQQLFGTVQTGDFDSRVNFVNKALNSSNRGRVGYYNNLNKRNKLRNIVNDIFRGTMTGYTPPLYNTSSLNYQYYDNPMYRFYNTRIPQTPHAYGNQNFITQTRVIIDDD